MSTKRSLIWRRPAPREDRSVLSQRPLQLWIIPLAEAEDRDPVSLLNAELIEGASDPLSLSVEADEAEAALRNGSQVCRNMHTGSVDQAAEIKLVMHATQARTVSLPRVAFASAQNCLARPRSHALPLCLGMTRHLMVLMGCEQWILLGGSRPIDHSLCSAGRRSCASVRSDRHTMKRVSCRVFDIQARRTYRPLWRLHL